MPQGAGREGQTPPAALPHVRCAPVGTPGGRWHGDARSAQGPAGIGASHTPRLAGRKGSRHYDHGWHDLGWQAARAQSGRKGRRPGLRLLPNRSVQHAGPSMANSCAGRLEGSNTTPTGHDPASPKTDRDRRSGMGWGWLFSPSPAAAACGLAVCRRRIAPAGMNRQATDGTFDFDLGIRAACR